MHVQREQQQPARRFLVITGHGSCGCTMPSELYGAAVGLDGISKAGTIASRTAVKCDLHFNNRDADRFTSARPCTWLKFRHVEFSSNVRSLVLRRSP